MYSLDTWEEAEVLLASQAPQPPRAIRMYFDRWREVNDKILDAARQRLAPGGRFLDLRDQREQP